MARGWMDFVEGRLETPFGPMHFAITQGDHVSISAGGSTDKLPRILVNRVPYYTHLHLFLQPDGSWIRKDEYREPYMSRTAGDDATRSAREKAYVGIKQAWEAFIAGDEISLLEAERSHLNNDIIRVEEQLKKAEKVVEDLDTKRDRLLAGEQAIENRRKELMKQGGYPAPRDWSPRGEVPEHGEEE